jgi:hypothetical protein
MAALLGPLIVSDPALSLLGWMGAVLIFGTNVYLAVGKARSRPDPGISGFHE